ncbi:MAG: SusC/RagA family TonB-linked outer membrane protein [Mangrovibacterium sp.]
MKKRLKLLFILVFPFMAAFAQQDFVVTGKVTDETNQGLPGVTVVEKGTNRGTITDVEGNYSLSAGGQASLVFSFIGYKSQEIPVEGKNRIDVRLTSDVVDVDEVVVVGYGTQRKADLTGAIGSVGSAEISRQPSVNAAKSIQGKVSGVNIINSDAPGVAPTVIVRGLGTALGGRNPLYIVDGFPVENISNISPSDIVSMDILKDASSASIYGVRAANGVIMITTKKGKAGKTQIGLESYYGVKSIQNQVKMANADQYTQYFNENQQALGKAWKLAEASKQPANTDWYDELTDLGQFNNQVVSLAGGGETVDYFFSYNYYGEDGILDKQDYQRSTIRNNNVYKFFDDRLKITQNLNISFSKDKPKPFSAFNDAYRQSPLVPVRYENGRYGRPFVNTTTGIVTYERQGNEQVGNLNSIGNPVFAVDNADEVNKTFTVQGGLEAELKITDYLKFNSRAGATKYYSSNRNFNNVLNAWLNVDPTRTREQFESLKDANEGVTEYAYNSLRIEEVETFRWIWENYLTFTKDFGQHHMEATVGGSKEETGVGNTMGATGYDVPDKKQYWNIDMASDDYEKEVNHTYYTPRTLMSFFGRVQYDYANKYYLTATLRQDGSSVFRENGDYWGTFPSVGLGWTVSKEEFFKAFGKVDFLKLRASWGKLGNQDVPLNVSQSLTDIGSSNYNYVFGPGQSLVFGAAFGTPAVPLSWEVTEEWSAGADFSLLDYKLSGSFDYYHKLNTNMILNVTPTLNSEYSQSYYAHGGEVLNSGIELSLSWKDQISNDLSYEVSMNYALNSNEVKDVTPTFDRATGGSLGNGEITKQLLEGQPLYAWWMYEAEGVWQNQTEIDSNPHLGSPKPGYLRYKDQNGDEVIDSRDKKFFGSYVPKSNYGIHVGVNYRSFDFNIDTYGVGGNRIYNGLKGTRIDGGENIAYDTWKDRWTGEGSTNSHPGAARDSYASSYYLEDGSFFRVNNITLGYSFNDLLVEKSKLRLYFTAQNPFVITGYSGFSPEISADGNPNGTTGIELSAYPTTRNFIFGVNFQF